MLFPSFFPMKHRKKHRKSCSFSHFPPAISERSVCPSEVLGLPVGGGWRYVSPGMFGPLLHTHINIHTVYRYTFLYVWRTYTVHVYIYTYVFIYLFVYLFIYLFLYFNIYTYSHNAQVKKSCDVWLTFPWPASGPPVEDVLICFTAMDLPWFT